MLVTWMLWAVLYTALAGAGALALDRIAGIWQLPRRGIWFAAVVLSVAAPPLFVAAHGPSQQPPPVSADGGPRVQVSRIVLTTIIRTARKARTQATDWLPEPLPNRVALRLWIALSTFFALLLLHASLRLAQRRRSWRAAVIDDVRVLIADDVGPAVVGFLRPAIVLPQWAIDAPSSERSLMLRHECEHVAAGDPRLLGAATLALVLCPFDLPLWWLVRRLRLAIELDCDRRVLRAIARPRDYGLLLIAVGARRGRLLPLAAPLAEQRPFLERRILAMTALRPSRPVIATLPFAAIALIAAVAAAQVPTPAPRAAAASVAPATAVAAPAAGDRQATNAAIKAAPALARAATVSAVRAAQARPSELVRAARASGAAGASGAVSATYSGSTAPVQPMIPISAIRALIAEHHPGVIAGDTSANVVTIVLDANKQYVASVARRVPVTRSVAPSADGRGRRIRIDSIANGEMRSAYARGGALDTIVVAGNSELLTGLPFQENEIAAVELLTLAPNMIAPTALRVVLLLLEPAG